MATIVGPMLLLLAVSCSDASTVDSTSPPAPATEAEMITASEPPGETWEEDRNAVEDFIARCNDL